MHLAGRLCQAHVPDHTRSVRTRPAFPVVPVLGCMGLKQTGQLRGKD